MVDLGLASLPSSNTSWPAFPDREPESPDQAITVYNIEPELVGTSMLSGSQIQREGFQVRIRDSTQNGLKARTVARVLEAVTGTTVTLNDSDSGNVDVSYLINMILRNNGPLYLGTASPQSGLHLFTINFITDLKEI